MAGIPLARGGHRKHPCRELTDPLPILKPMWAQLPRSGLRLSGNDTFQLAAFTRWTVEIPFPVILATLRML